jgi:uncharacterized coiled-coil DUF342 family protein
MTIAEAKVYEEKISAQLHEAKALIDEFEAHAKKNKAEAKIEKINTLKKKREEIEKKLHQLLKVGVAANVATQIKADIDAELGKFKASLEEFASKHKN